MADWIKHSTFSSRTERTVNRTAYLEPLRDEILRTARDYYKQLPKGTQVTLACLKAIGLQRIEQLAVDYNSKTGTVKQDLGLFIAIVLLDVVGGDHLETYRNPKTFRNSTRSCGKAWPTLSGWVSRYTPHRLTPKGLATILGGPSDLQAQA